MSVTIYGVEFAGVHESQALIKLGRVVTCLTIISLSWRAQPHYYFHNLTLTLTEQKSILTPGKTYFIHWKGQSKKN